MTASEQPSCMLSFCKRKGSKLVGLAFTRLQFTVIGSRAAATDATGVSTAAPTLEAAPPAALPQQNELQLLCYGCGGCSSMKRGPSLVQ